MTVLLNVTFCPNPKTNAVLRAYFAPTFVS